MSSFEFLLDKSAGASARDVVQGAIPSPPPQPGTGNARDTSPRAVSAMLQRAFPGEDSNRVALDRADRELLNALAAFQIRYGKPEEALAFLQLTNRLWPEDPQTLRLLSQAFLALEDYASAEMTEDAYRRANRAERPSRSDLLRQAIIHFGCLRLNEARQSLFACFAMNRQEG